MPIYDFECPCGKITESIQPVGVEAIDCECGGTAVKIVSSSGHFCANEDADWIRSVTEVVDKDCMKPTTQEFLRNPTRTNMRRWMQAEGLRHMEPGEGPKREKPDMGRIRREVRERAMARRRIEI